MDGAERALNGATAGQWIRLGEAPRGYPEVVGDLVPAGFEAYARIFHPVRIPGLGWSTWSAAALRHGFELTRLTQLPDILDHEEVNGVLTPIGDRYHHLPRLEWHELGSLVRRHCEAASFFVGFWEGAAHPADSDRHELLELPNRRYFVVEIPIALWHDSRTVVDSSPNLVWTSDKSWFFNSDIDCSSTYLGGSRELVNDLVASPDLEALEVQLDDPIFLS